jgi:hypothetical protein
MGLSKKFIAKNGLDNNSQTISNVADPVNAQDAVTKNFGTNASNLATGTVAAGRLPAFSGDASSTVGTSVLTLSTSGVTAGTYGSASLIPVIAVDAKGRVTSASTQSVSIPSSITIKDEGTTLTSSPSSINFTGLSVTSTTSGTDVTVNISAATGGTGSAAFYENDSTVVSNYTITSGKNAMSAGPMTINNGVTVTVPDGSVWSIV